MRFVIYGAGKRGREILAVLGKENVLAFADQDIGKSGKQYCGLPVIGIESLKGMAEDVMCILTPVLGRDAIARNLSSKGIQHMIYAKPFDRVLYYEKDAVLSFICSRYKKNEIGIHGVSAGSILLYEYLMERADKNVFFILDEEESAGNRFAKKNFAAYHFCDALHKAEVVISTEANLNKNAEEAIINSGIELVKMQDLLEANISFYNKEVEYFKNIHKGQRCFIVATGASLSAKDLETLYLHNEKCISMNRIYNIFGNTSWRPDYYMIEDMLMIEDLSREIADMDIPVKFIASEPASYWEQDGLKNSIKYQLFNLDHQGDDLPLFSSKAERCIYEGSTVTYACIQMAVYMGFREIYLLGVDFNYSSNLYDEKNHFAGYQRDGMVRLNAVQPERMKAAYQSAREYADANGIYIYNATRGGKLEVFERVGFDAIFCDL